MKRAQSGGSNRPQKIWGDLGGLSDGLVSESRRKEKSIPYEQYRTSRLKKSSPRG
jgi:hypothetical protein